MAEEILKADNLFISYSWTTPELENWVRNLAERLELSNVSVTLDKWDLKPGHDAFHFMEKSIKSSEIQKVLIICDKGYFERAEERKGGVGTETLIISPDVYKDTKQEKFIPILYERIPDGSPYLPTYLDGRVYMDFSTPQLFEENLDRLLRILFHKPEFSRPKKGKTPKWLSEDAPVLLQTGNILNQLNDAVLRNPGRIKVLLEEFQDAFLVELEQFEFTGNQTEIPRDEELVNKIKLTLPLRDNFISYIDLYVSVYQDNLDIDPIVSFFEKLYPFALSEKKIQVELFQFLIHEFILYTVAILLKRGLYNKTNELINSSFFVVKSKGNPISDVSLIEFRPYLPILDEERKKRMNVNRISLHADLLMERATLLKYPKESIVEADLILYYLLLIKENYETFNLWFPLTYVYRNNAVLSFLTKLRSKKHFKNIAQLFGDQTKDKLQLIFKQLGPLSGYRDSYHSIPGIEAFINREEFESIN